MATPDAAQSRHLDVKAFNQGYDHASKAVKKGNVKNPEAKAHARKKDCQTPNPTSASDYSCGAHYALKGIEKSQARVIETVTRMAEPERKEVTVKVTGKASKTSYEIAPRKFGFMMNPRDEMLGASLRYLLESPRDRENRRKQQLEKFEKEIQPVIKEFWDSVLRSTSKK